MGFPKWVPITAATLGIFFIISCFAEKAPYSFAKDATSAARTEYYDYIVVGGGTAGCALAATLSATKKVLLLERGGLLTLMDTSPSSAAQHFISTDGVINNRARVLGGGSAINVGFYSRASREYVQEVGWDPRLVKESYEWVERKLVFRPRVIGWQAAVRDGLLEAGVSPDNGFTYEHLQGTKTGGSIFDENGYRHTAADLLEYANPTMITLYLNATVTQILFETLPGRKPKAYAVLFRDLNGRSHIALLKKCASSEIIVSAGAIGSPQLLMLSGIGPAHHLKAHGINVIFEQPMVGQGMSDNPLNQVEIPSRRPIGISVTEVVGILDDVGFYIEAASFQFSGAGSIGGKVARPYSSGYLELRSNDWNENPRVTFNYFKDPRDLETCVKGMEITRRFVESKAISQYRYTNTSFQSLLEFTFGIPTKFRKRPLIGETLSLEQFCVDAMTTTCHYHGGCQVGRVVDPDYKVMGVDSLRVIDGSTFYNSPGTNPQATVMMLGRYMGKKILQQTK